MANAYDKGKTVRVSALFTVGGEATDPTTVPLKGRKPGSGVVSYTYALAEVTKDSTGNYHKDIVGNESGSWYHQWIGTGTCETAEEDSFIINASGFSAGIGVPPPPSPRRKTP